MVDDGVRVFFKTGLEGFFELRDLAVGFRDDLDQRSNCCPEPTGPGAVIRAFLLVEVPLRGNPTGTSSNVSSCRVVLAQRVTGWCGGSPLLMGKSTHNWRVPGLGRV